MSYDEMKVAELSAEPRAFSIIEQCHREIETIIKKANPILVAPRPEPERATPKDTSDMVMRLDGLLDHLRSVSNRISL